jgi:hypothetical protein
MISSMTVSFVRTEGDGEGRATVGEGRATVGEGAAGDDREETTITGEERTILDLGSGFVETTLLTVVDFFFENNSPHTLFFIPVNVIFISSCENRHVGSEHFTFSKQDKIA